MNKEFEDFKGYVDKMNYSIQRKLDCEELEFYQKLTKRFNDVCKDKEILERSFYEVVEVMYDTPIVQGFVPASKVQKIEKIIRKALKKLVKKNDIDV